MVDWRAHLRQNAEANQSFISYLERQMRIARQQLDEAPSWEAVIEARGRLKILAIMQTSLTMDDKEEAAHARAFGPARTVKSV